MMDKGNVVSRTTTPELLSVLGNNTGVGQLNDLSGETPPRLQISFTRVDLLDSSSTFVFTGQVIVTLTGELRPGPLAIVTRLLSPFHGLFSMGVFGTYTVYDTAIEIQTSDVRGANIQPI